jgi:urease accessory protein
MARVPVAAGLGCGALLLAQLLLAPAASAHHLMDLTGLAPTPLNGLLSGLAHPLIGPDHLVFLLALSLVGLRHRGLWMIGVLAVGLAGSALGLLLPGLPGAEVLVALSLVLLALVLQGRLPRLLLLPAFALHGYVLSASVLAWSPFPLTTYLLGLLVSQSLLLLIALTVLRRLATRLSSPWPTLLSSALIGFGVITAFNALAA